MRFALVGSWRWRKALAPYVFISPFLILFTVLWVGPIIASFYLSFTTGTQTSRFIGTANYVRLFWDPYFRTAISNTILAAVVYVAALTVIAVILALVLELPFVVARWFFRSAVFVPITMSLVVTALVFQLIYTTSGGLANQLLTALGLPPVSWLTDPRLALWSIVLMRLWRASGYYSLIVLAGMQNISKDVLEAAAIDGASYLRTVWYILLPLLKPVIAFVVITSMIWGLQLFDEVWVLTRGGPISSTTTMVTYLYQNAFLFFRFGYAAAISYVLTLIIMIFSVLQLRLFEEK